MAKGTNRILLVPLHLVEQMKPSNGHRHIQISRAPKTTKKRCKESLVVAPYSPSHGHTFHGSRPPDLHTERQPTPFVIPLLLLSLSLSSLFLVPVIFNHCPSHL